MEEKKEQLDLFNFDKPVIKGFPELRWTGKSPIHLHNFSLHN